MLIALMTDIHGNREALSACLAHAAEAGAGRYVFLGDYVGYGADPGWVVDQVAALVRGGAVALLGNHDEAALSAADASDMNPVAREAIEWTRAQLDASQRDFLSRLPLTTEEGDSLYVHASADVPRQWGYVVGPEDAKKSLLATPHRLTFCGHVHVPAIYRLTETDRLASFRPRSDVAIPLLKHRRWLAVIGSVGQPRDRDPAACYGLFDDEQETLTYVRVPYDLATAAQKILDAGLPPFLAVRLEHGF
jgi:diadenosine tetraphosphatase ApaH/serine/threonine PP2A family protein phosphatase